MASSKDMDQQRLFFLWFESSAISPPGAGRGRKRTGKAHTGILFAIENVQEADEEAGLLLDLGRRAKLASNMTGIKKITRARPIAKKFHPL